MLAGQAILGFSVSEIVITKSHSEEFPAESVALNFKVLVPTGNRSPEFKAIYLF